MRGNRRWRFPKRRDWFCDPEEYWQLGYQTTLYIDFPGFQELVP